VGRAAAVQDRNIHARSRRGSCPRFLVSVNNHRVHAARRRRRSGL